MNNRDPQIQVVYSAVHPQCGYRIACTHPKIFSRADLKSLCADMAIKGRL
jgi:hypothetical protein